MAVDADDHLSRQFFHVMKLSEQRMTHKQVDFISTRITPFTVRHE